MEVVIRKSLFVAFISFIFLTGIFTYQQSRFNDGKLHVVFCNVGQGDGIFIKTPKGLDILIDGGPDESILSCLSNNMPFWDRQIELMLLSHSHQDHSAGLIDVIKRYGVLSFYTEKTDDKSSSYKELLRILKEKNTKIAYLNSGDSFFLKDGIKISTIWPDAEVQEQSLDANNQSLVELLSYKNFDVLLTGDSSLKQVNLKNALFDNIGSKNISVEVLKIPHHGSKSGIDGLMLKSLNPALAVISVGKNSYGHPSKEILSLLSEFKIKFKRTDLDGEVEIISDGNNWSLNNEL